MAPRAHAGEFAEELARRLRKHKPRRKGLPRSVYPDFGGLLLKRIDESMLLDRPAEEWVERLEEIFALVAQREEDEILVRVTAPVEAEGEDGALSRIITCMVDQPFLVDTLRNCLDREGLEVSLQVNAIVPALRTAKGRLKGIDWDDVHHHLESVTFFEVPALPSEAARSRLEKELQIRLELARAMGDDFESMLRVLRDLVNDYEYMANTDPKRAPRLREVRDFLHWLLEDNFVFMGLTPLPSRKSGDGRLGVFRIRRNAPRPSDEEGKKFVEGKQRRDPLLIVRKTDRESKVHRAGKIDEILIRRFDDKGKPSGAILVHGLFTFRAIHTQGSTVPLLRGKLDELVESEELVPGTYNHKGVVSAFNSLPVEYLFGASASDIRSLVRRVRSSARALKPDAYLDLQSARGKGYLFVVMPARNYGEEMRQRIQQRVEQRLGSNYSDHRVFMGNSGMAVLHCYFSSPRSFPRVDRSKLEAEILDLARSWTDRFRDALLQELDREQARDYFRDYAHAFSPRYEVSTEVGRAVRDVCILEELRRGEFELGFDLYRDDEDLEGGTAKLRIYERENLYLTAILPVLDNFGLTVRNSFTNRARHASGQVLFMDTFRFEVEGMEIEEVVKEQDRLLDALRLVFGGGMANDRLNRLLLPAGLEARQLDLLRSYQAYGRQLGTRFTPATIWRPLVQHAPILRAMVEYFETRFGPEAKGRSRSKPSTARTRKATKQREEILRAIDQVEGFAEDRILRTFLQLIDATLRTSYFQDAPRLAHKIDCSAVGVMENPRPWREIYVHHAELEGVHLRGGPVARGGLRWSDRVDDYRTEILGLMTTQMVKNVVIVPVGAKGGFVLRRPEHDPAARRAQADRLYEVFIHSLLDLTDDMVEGVATAPDRVVCYDDPDPYLVVAADKGTAHLSDTANRISQSRDFWLGDAFASGGSHGYDHKKLGITARGAWVCMRHHFSEMGIDPARDEFSVAGIGDMGGDVFGNGMLEHEKIRLRAAFNHLHIFLDPNPDAPSSFAERKRLFEAAKSGWDAYDPKRISAGGGVFERKAKSVPLSPEAQAMLGLESDEASPNEVIRAILRMEVDLLYNGGIGTYVKASFEPDDAAHDPANQALRVNADELRAAAVGEGGNLGLTPAARIEYARLGGRINTDFIDNAAGVNTSDHEVNLKILLGGAMESGRLKLRARNTLLQDLEPHVVEDVLDANGSQALMLSLDERRSRESLAPFDRLIEELVRRRGEKRSEMGLPGIKEIDRRISEGEGLTRPELALLGSFVKLLVYADLVATADVDLEGLRPYLLNYFPDRLRSRFAEEIHSHHLGREIALTRLTNRIVDMAGSTFFHDMRRQADAGLVESVQAYSLASRLADLWTLKDRVCALAPEVEAEVRYRALLQIESALRASSLHLLESWSAKRIRETLRETTVQQRRLRELAKELLSALDPISLETATGVVEDLKSNGVPEETAARVARSRYLPYGLVVLDLAEKSKRPAVAVARDYFSLGRASGIFAAVEAIDAKPQESYYDSLALKAMRRDLLELVERLVVKLGEVAGDDEARLDELGEGRRALEELGRIEPEELGPASLLVAVERIRSVLR